MNSERIQIIGEDQKPLTNTKVTVRQTRGSVIFGCAGFETVQVIGGEPPAKEGFNEYDETERKHAVARIEKMVEIFDFITLPFYWGRYEPIRGIHDTKRTLKAAKWLRERGKIVKGHPLCWHTVCADWLLEFSDEEILKQQLSRIERDVSAFSGIIDMWDVINEVVIMPVFDRYDNAVTRICKREGQVGLVKKVFQAAKATNPKSTLLINDFDMSTDYSDLISKLLDAGVCIDAIGLQSHMHQGMWRKEKTLEILERFSKFGLPLHFTEINLVSGELMPPHIVDLNDFVPDEWPSTQDGEKRQAEQATEFYRLLFDCSLVEAVTWWSFSDGGWLNAPTGLVTEDGRVKPVYDAIYNLIHNEWRTQDKSYVTDDSGYIEIEGFRGDYTATTDDGRITNFTL